MKIIRLKDKTGKELGRAEIMEKTLTRIWNVFLDFELMVLRYIGNIPVHFVRRFFYKLAGIKIGENSTIHMWCNFFNPANIEIGDDTIIGDHAFLDGRTKLTIGSHTDIASSVMIYNSQHNIHDENFTAEVAEVTIADYVFIGPRVIILPGVTIGRGAVIGAGAVVTKNIASGMIVGGVPAVVIGKREIKSYHYRLGRYRLFQ